MGSLPTRRAAERRTRSNRAKVPRGSPASRELQSAGVNTASYKCVDKGESGLVWKRTGNHPKLAQLIVSLPFSEPNWPSISFGSLLPLAACFNFQPISIGSLPVFLFSAYFH